MRVIGGSARGRRLKVPKGHAVRPTGARVKESLFDILPRDFSGMRVLDLFAGSGNVAMEALSRGAEMAILIDESPRSAAAIHDNLIRLGFKGRAQVWIAPVFRSLRKLSRANERFQLIFLDPPYDKGLSGTTLKIIAQAELLDKTGRVVVEHSAREAVKPRYDALVLHDQRRYGDTLLSFFTEDAASMTSGARGINYGQQ